jgi:hypothetical protein
MFLISENEIGWELAIKDSIFFLQLIFVFDEGNFSFINWSHVVGNFCVSPFALYRVICFVPTCWEQVVLSRMKTKYHSPTTGVPSYAWSTCTEKHTDIVLFVLSTVSLCQWEFRFSLHSVFHHLLSQKRKNQYSCYVLFSEIRPCCRSSMCNSDAKEEI